MFKDSTPRGFLRKFFKDRVVGGGGGVGVEAAGVWSAHAHFSRWVGIKVRSQVSPVFWFQSAWCLSACGQQFSSVSCKNNLGMDVRCIYIFRELGAL